MLRPPVRWYNKFTKHKLFAFVQVISFYCFLFAGRQNVQIFLGQRLPACCRQVENSKGTFSVSKGNMMNYNNTMGLYIMVKNNLNYLIIYFTFHFRLYNMDFQANQQLWHGIRFYD